ncbi:MarR family transcriptional regulator [Bradyrhizobium sp. KB893862 SZCCT0404]|uniref:MarR family winged helix-turn-helix transcriptional regulator n=1 Tax=Bradyrhizobium sp. KB893862 SZCCT0404 TaxID=2807672 RepID=UPI001BA47314|nr:MarR family transcriptional regulator [Bradyrhizobium sp. KB893862 SZCCT0404]MBR1175304.1 MarR family transcriptional regulator [Bradyrhizobium sp. KB893862 SZCCT0404]
MKKLVLEDFIPYRLNRLGAVVSQRLKKVYSKKFGLTIPQWRVLATLGQFERLTATEIGRHSGMHKTKVSRAVRDLEVRRWLTRIEIEEDRRFETLMLTAAGRKAYDAIVPEMAGFEERMLDKIGAGQTRTVLDALNCLERALGAKESRKGAIVRQKRE